MGLELDLIVGLVTKALFLRKYTLMITKEKQSRGYSSRTRRKIDRVRNRRVSQVLGFLKEAITRNLQAAQIRPKAAANLQTNPKLAASGCSMKHALFEQVEKKIWEGVEIGVCAW